MIDAAVTTRVPTADILFFVFGLTQAKHELASLCVFFLLIGYYSIADAMMT